MVTRGNKQDHETKLLDILTKLEKAGYRASERKFKFFMNRTKWLGHEVDEKGIKPNEEKLEAIFKLNPPENTKKNQNHFSEQYKIWQNFYRNFRNKQTD